MSVPEGDTHDRAVCAACGFVAYENPKVVVGSVVAHGGRVLLCRRAIEPRRGFWTLPAGYLELNETLEEGAKREAQEEAGARIRPDGILALFSIARIGQVQVIFRAGFDGEPAFAPGNREPGSGAVRVGPHTEGGHRLSVRALGAGRMAHGRRTARSARRSATPPRTRAASTHRE